MADDRRMDRDKNAEISREVINRLDEVSLSNLHRAHEMGQLNHASSSGQVI